jgi:SAM-dependent methyltransferase
MLRSALQHLVDPYTSAPLAVEATATSGDDVREGTLRAGDKSYAVVEGIPRFVSQDVADDQTVRSFSQKWEKHRYYRQHTAGFYTSWYLERYGLGDLAGLQQLLRETRFVLDAGTGSGRDAAWFAENGDAQVYGVDTAWDALRITAAEVKRPNLAFVHADVNRLPFPDEFFDLVNCDQVIHHTPDPPATFRNLRRKLKTGGQICCYVYRKKAVIREFVDDYVRERIKDMPIGQALALCEGITKLGKAFAGLRANVEIEEDIPILGIHKGRYDVQRFLHWNVLKCFWNDDFDFFTNNVVNFDWYHPVYCFRYHPEEFKAWLADGWEILAWDEREAGLSCRARKVQS